MTVKEIVEKVIVDLGNVNVQVSQLNSIGMPIAHAIQGLQLCVQAWDEEAARKAEQAQEEDDGVKLEVVPAEDMTEEDREALNAEDAGK